LKIALVVPGGVDRSAERRVVPALLAVISRLARRHEVHVYALAQEAGPGTWQLLGATVHNIGDPRGAWKTAAAIQREHARAPFDVIQAFWAGWSGLAAVIAGKRIGAPVCVHLAGGELATLRRIGYGGARHLHSRMMNRFVLRYAAQVTAASAQMVESAARFGVTARRIALGVDLERWPPRPPRARAPGAPARCVHVASLNRVKDQRTLLEALRLVAARREITLDIVGEDTLHGAVQSHAARLGLANIVRFHRERPQREVRAFVETADLNLVSSLHEAGPLVVLEAAVAGVPTVGTAVGHIAEWAPAAAIAVPPGNARELADAIESLLADEPRRLALAEEAQRRAIAEDADHTAAALESMYARLPG